jgi:GTP-binding protein
MNHRFTGFEPMRGEIPRRMNGSLISMEQGTALAYSIDRLQDRGIFFIEPGEEIYKSQIVGEHTRGNDLEVNLTKGKKLTNMRASGSDEKMRIAPAKVLRLELGIPLYLGHGALTHPAFALFCQPAPVAGFGTGIWRSHGAL